MPQRRPKPDAIDLARKLRPEPLPALAKNLSGGVLDRQPEPSYHHVGELPDRRNVEHLPPTEPPVEELMREHEAAVEAAQEGHVSPPEDEGLAPPVNVPFSGEGPAERFD